MERTMFYSALSQFYNRLKLRTAILLPFITLVSLSMGTVGFLSLSNGQLAVNDVTHQLRNEIMFKIKNHLDNFLSSPSIINQYTINALQQGYIQPSDSSKIARYFAQHLKNYPTISYLQYAQETGEITGLGREKQNFQLELADTNTQYQLNSYPTNEQGERTQSHPIQSSPRTDLNQQDWYQTAILNPQGVWNISVGKSQWSAVLNFLGHSWLALSYNTPIFDTQKKFQGVISTQLVLDNISQFLHHLNVSPNGYTFIMERSGALIASSDTEKIFELDNLSLNLKRYAALDSPHFLTRFITQQLTQQYPDLQTIQTAIQTSFILNNEQYFVELAPYKLNNLDWFIIIVSPEKDFMGRIHLNTQLTLVLIAITFICAIIISIFLANWMITPIISLNLAAKNIATGQWQHYLPLNRQDEIGELAIVFKKMSEQLRDMFETLEHRVIERTHELAQANEEILTLNEYLKENNARMFAELEITRQFQQMLLPTKQELKKIEEFDIAGFMQPAEEVGGDYYDILKYGDRIQIAIGDVTGHGLASGMLMLMVQMAIRTLFIHQIQPNNYPLATLNIAIYDNIQRMKSDKNLTLSLLEYQRGKLTISGQHEEVLVIRRTGKVERIDTVNLGFFVGMIKDIQPMTHQIELQLNYGDGIVLYTDGITETLMQNGELYGVERLAQIASQYWHLSAHEIQNLVIEDIKRNAAESKLKDDLTLVIIKQLV